MATLKFTVGLLLRREMRAQLEAASVKFTEHKGWLDSIFVAHGSGEQMRSLLGWLKEMDRAEQ